MNPKPEGDPPILQSTRSNDLAYRTAGASRRVSTETKAAGKTTELIAYVVVIIAVLVAPRGRSDDFTAKDAWFFVDAAGRRLPGEPRPGQVRQPRLLRRRPWDRPRRPQRRSRRPLTDRVLNEHHARPVPHQGAGRGSTVAAAPARLAAGAGGLVLAAVTRLAAARPAAKPLHPRGAVVRGTLQRFGAAGATGVPWLDQPGSDEVRAPGGRERSDCPRASPTSSAWPSASRPRTVATATCCSPPRDWDP